MFYSHFLFEYNHPKAYVTDTKRYMKFKTLLVHISTGERYFCVTVSGFLYFVHVWLRSVLRRILAILKNYKYNFTYNCVYK